MIADTLLFQIYGSMARYASEAQRVSATNIARSGEAGYKAVELESFQDYIARETSAAGMADGSLSTDFRLGESNTPAAPNGNTVSIEQELFKSAEAQGQHELALTVYSKSLDLLRTALGRR